MEVIRSPLVPEVGLGFISDLVFVRIGYGFCMDRAPHKLTCYGPLFSNIGCVMILNINIYCVGCPCQSVTEYYNKCSF
jgi:hypothetical protein